MQLDKVKIVETLAFVTVEEAAGTADIMVPMVRQEVQVI